MLRLLASFAAAPIPYELLLDAGLLAARSSFQDITGPVLARTQSPRRLRPHRSGLQR